MSSLQATTTWTRLDSKVDDRHYDLSVDGVGFCQGKQSHLRLLDEWIEQTTLPESVVNEPEEHAVLEEAAPLLIIDEWERLLHLLAEAFNQVGELQLTMHGLFWTDIGCRFASARPDISSIREAVIRSWEDYFRGNLVGYLHLIVPQERLIANELHFIVEMRLPQGEPPENGAPVLRRITWHYLESGPQVLAVYPTSGMSRSAFLAQAGLAQLCLAPDSRQCNLRIQLPFSPVILQPGSLVEIFLHGVDIDEASPDEVGFMQQPRPSLSPDLIPIRLLGLNYVNMLFYANQNEALITQLRRTWPLSTSRPENLEAVHYVACPPATSGPQQEHFYLIHQREDRFSQIHINDVLILVTISFTAPDRSKIQKIRVLWGPRRATRSQFLSFLRLSWFCEQPSTLCWIYLNNHPWVDQATVTRRLEYGDHLRVQIRSDSAQWSDIEYAEDVSCSLRIYRDSPPAEDPPETQDPEEEEEEEGSLALTRSRSRSLGRSASPPVAAGVADDVGSGDESPSLIQTGVKKRLLQQGLSPAVDPHVSDRWCEKQSGISPGCTPASGPDLRRDGAVSSQLSRPPPLFSLVAGCRSLPPWKLWLAEHQFQDSRVRSLGDFLLSLRPWPDTAFSTTWHLLPERHEFVDLIHLLQPVPGPVGEFHVFLDGSYFPSSGSCAWAFSVVLRDHRGNYYRWGFTGDIIEKGAGSLHAEAEAFVFALDWIVSTISDTARPVHIYGDATAIGFGADGSQNIAKGLEDLGRQVRSLFCLAQSALPSVSYHHVKAHSGQPDNELVDSAAKAIALQQWSPHTGIPSRLRWSNAPLLPWAWMLVENAHGHTSSLPSLDDLASGFALPSIPLSHIDPFGLQPEVPSEAPKIQVSLKIGSANVRSLKEGKPYNGFYDKLALIATQAIAKNFDVLALQETRSRLDCVSSFNGLSRLVAAAEKGQGGIELWINPEGQLSKAGFGPLGVQHCHVRASSPTWLVVDCDHPLLQCTFVVAYAPQAGRSSEDIAGWWKDFSRLLLQLRTRVAG